MTSETTIEMNLDVYLQRLSPVNLEFSRRFPGFTGERQPVHTVYGGANLYRSGAANKISTLASKHFDEYAPSALSLAKALHLPDVDSEAQIVNASFGDPAWICKTLHQRVKAKLSRQAIEDHRVDFEDGYGARSDAEEDGHCYSAADAMAEALLDGSLPPMVGLRVKAFSEEAKIRCLRTIQLFLTRLLAKTDGKLPAHFCVTMPKVISPMYVAVMCDFLSDIETTLGLSQGQIKLELMLENVQCLFDADGTSLIPKMVAAGEGRVRCFVLGTFDYTATANIASSFQSHDHATADFGRQMMIANLMNSDVTISDGVTNIMPIPPHKGVELTEAQVIENQETVYAAWRLHFNNIMHSQVLGIYQGWDLNPAQIPVRYMAVYYFFLFGLHDATERLKTFINKAAQASMVGNTFDDAATGQGLVNFFVNGLGCGALDESEVLATGITLDELNARSFMKIVENRT